MNALADLVSQIPQATKKRALVATGLIAIVLGVWFSNSQAPEAKTGSTHEFAPLSPTSFFVHVAGAVNSPGLYELAAGDRVSDAIDRAGGFSDAAIESSVNLARMVSDGEQIVVLHEDQLVETSGFISLNSASASKLEELPGIGPATAKKIVEYRQRVGSFSSIEQLTEVPGIGSKLLERIRDQLTL